MEEEQKTVEDGIMETGDRSDISLRTFLRETERNKGKETEKSKTEGNAASNDDLMKASLSKNQSKKLYKRFGDAWKNFRGNKKDRKKPETTKSDEELEGIQAMFRGPLDTKTSSEPTGLTPKVKKVGLDSTGAPTLVQEEKATEFIKPFTPNDSPTETRIRISQGLDELENRESKLRKDLDEYKNRINLQQTCSKAENQKIDSKEEGMEEGEISSGEEGFNRNLLNGKNLMNSTMSEELRTGEHGEDPLFITPAGVSAQGRNNPFDELKDEEEVDLNSGSPKPRRERYSQGTLNDPLYQSEQEANDSKSSGSSRWSGGIRRRRGGKRAKRKKSDDDNNSNKKIKESGSRERGLDAPKRDHPFFSRTNKPKTDLRQQKADLADGEADPGKGEKEKNSVVEHADKKKEREKKGRKVAVKQERRQWRKQGNVSTTS